MEKFDVVVIGSGPGGYVAAIRAAQLGLKTGIVEKKPTLGGTCLNIGCIPSKALLQSTELYHEILHNAAKNGIECPSPVINLSQMMKRKQEIVTSLVEGVAGLIKRNKITRFEGIAKFQLPHIIDVFGKEAPIQVESKSFILATGSESINLPFLPIDEKKIVTSTGALSFEKVPQKLIVIGAGVIGVELASVYKRLGSDVTIVEMLDRICPTLDNGIGRVFQQILKKQGLNFLLSTQVANAQIEDEAITLFLNHEGKSSALTGDAVLVAVGRKPASANLGLDKIGVALDKKSFVIVDGNFRTSIENIYAIGDLIDGPMLAHKASEEGAAAAEIVAGHSARIDYLTLPNVIYTSPEVASVGLTEEEAKALALNVKVGTSQFKGNPRARCTGHDEGLVKIIGEARSGRVLGLHIIGDQASEMIGEGVIAIGKKATLEDIANGFHAHPTRCEAIKEAALAALGRAIHV